MIAVGSTMAPENSSFSYSVLHGSDVIYDFTCTPCARKDKTAEATSYCTSCSEYFCSTCIDFHNNFPALSDHLDKVLGEADMKKRGPQRVRAQLTEKCHLHDDKVVELYCKEHDVVGCATCTALDHRLCVDVQYIPVIAGGIGKSAEVKTVKDALQQTTEKLQHMKKVREEQKLALFDKKVHIIKTITEFRNQINEAIDKVQQESIEELEERYNGINAHIAEDIAYCETNITTMEKLLQKLDTADPGLEAQTFVNVKLGKTLTENAYKAHQDIIAASDKIDIKFSIDENILASISKLKSFGEFFEEPKLSAIGNTKIITFKLKDDPGTIGKIACCQRPDGMVLVVDSNNHNLKLINPTCDGVVEHCTLPSFPRAVCTISPREAAVTLENHKVQIVAMGTGDKKLIPTSSIPLNHSVFGIACLNNELFISDGGKNIYVYLTSGTYRRTINVDENGRDLFSQAGHIAVSHKTSALYVVDGEKGLLKLNTRGTLIWSFTDTDLSDAHDIALDKYDNVFVCGNWSHNVLQIGPYDCKKMGTLLSASDGLKYPTSLCFERFKNKLVVGMGARGYLKVFDLK